MEPENLTELHDKPVDSTTVAKKFLSSFLSTVIVDRRHLEKFCSVSSVTQRNEIKQPTKSQNKETRRRVCVMRQSEDSVKENV